MVHVVLTESVMCFIISRLAVANLSDNGQSLRSAIARQKHYSVVIFMAVFVTFYNKFRIISHTQTKAMKEINEYVIGELVQIATTNPREDPTGKNDSVWHDGIITDINTIYPSRGEKFKPYPMLIVKFMRTYCSATPQYHFIDGVKIYVDSILTFYDKESHEGFFYRSQIRPR